MRSPYLHMKALLILTTFATVLDEIKELYDGEVILASDLDVFTGK